VRIDTRSTVFDGDATSLALPIALGLSRSCHGRRAALWLRFREVRRRTAPRAASSMEDRDAPKVRALGPPHPGWVPGQKQPNAGLSGRTVSIDSSLPGMYPLVISAVVPRPIALVSTVDAAGVVNVAPFSYFGAMAHDPPHVAFAISHPGPGVEKDTLRNLKGSGDCCVHIISHSYVEAANHTSIPADPGVSELDLAGLTAVPCDDVKPPRLAEAAVAMEGKLVHTYDVHNAAGALTTTMCIVHVTKFHIAEEVLEGREDGKVGRVNYEKLAPVARLGGITYGMISETFDIPRPPKP